MKVKMNPAGIVMFFGACLVRLAVVSMVAPAGCRGLLLLCVGRGKGWSWLQVFSGLLAHEPADCSGLGKLGNTDSQSPTFLVGNVFIWGQLCSSHLELGLPELQAQ